MEALANWLWRSLFHFPGSRASSAQVAGASSGGAREVDIQLLRSSAGNFTTSTEECIGDNLRDNSILFFDTPDPGQGFWFLVRTSDIGGGLDTYDSGGASQVEPRDGEINASPAPCATSTTQQGSDPGPERMRATDSRPDQRPAGSLTGPLGP